ncbi:MAG: hypothetical protein L0Y54_22005, partial [Sporichthyaceae bacterium]|nr:hypothetical protein [Sporichthyaceae bacterium]
VLYLGDLVQVTCRDLTGAFERPLVVRTPAVTAGAAGLRVGDTAALWARAGDLLLVEDDELA